MSYTHDFDNYVADMKSVDAERTLNRVHMTTAQIAYYTGFVLGSPANLAYRALDYACKGALSNRTIPQMYAPEFEEPEQL